MGQLISVLKDNKQELEFLKDHGSNNQLFLVLRKKITNIQKTEIKLHDMTSAINEIDMEFEESRNLKIETIGSLILVYKYPWIMKTTQGVVSYICLSRKWGVIKCPWG
jgi:aspartyl/asparaginyl-tRNA synthetase